MKNIMHLYPYFYSLTKILCECAVKTIYVESVGFGK